MGIGGERELEKERGREGEGGEREGEMGRGVRKGWGGERGSEWRRKEGGSEEGA